MKKCANRLLLFLDLIRKESYDLQSFLSGNKERSPRREKTRALYLEIEAANELEGRIQARKLVEENTPTILNLSSSCLTNTSNTKKSQALLN